MFTGEYHYVIDEKNRVAIPAVWRKRIDSTVDGMGLYITIGMDQCLILYLPRQFEEQINRIKQLPFTSKKARDFQRLFFSSMYPLEGWDKQGRIMIPQKLKDYAKIDKEVFIIGIMNHMEIWDKSEWHKFKEENSGRFSEIAEDIQKIF